LTNGVYTQDYFWTRGTTVGWTHADLQPVVITIDLGAVQTIGGASYSTAAGAGGVHWPTNIFLLTSEDDSTWFLAGDLVSLDRAASAPPSPDVYGTHRFSSTRLDTRGRYVAFVIESDFFVFCDEVEVAAGAAAPTHPQGRQVPDPLTFGWTGLRMLRWVDTVSERLSRLPDSTRKRIAPGGPVEYLAATPTSRMPPEDFHARRTVPYTREQEQLFRLNGTALEASGAPPLRIWKLHRYDPLDPIQSPSAGAAPALVVESMNGERRADALVLTNGTGRPQRVHIRVTGLPGGPNPRYLEVFEVQFVETTPGFLAASALQEAGRDGGDFVATIPAGLNRQLWFSVQPTDLAPGVHQGTLRVQSEQAGVPTQSVPFTLRISSVPFPTRPTIHLGGWDDTNLSGSHHVTAANRDQLVQFLQERYVDAPWATSGVLGHPAASDFAEDCTLRRDLDFSELDDWILRWRSARLFLAFLNGGDDFVGHAAGTAEFRRCIGSWLVAVAARLRHDGVSPSRVGLLLVDEPRNDAQAVRAQAWADAVHLAGTGMFVWEDPQFPEPGREPAASALRGFDLVSPSVPQYLAMTPDDRSRVRQPEGSTKVFWLYNTLGPSHALDPYAYYELSFWLAFREGAEGVGFWSFADAGAWNESASPTLVHTPEYLAPDGVTDSKQMMAIVEGVEDFEYLRLLRDRLGRRDSSDVGGVVREGARLLSIAPDTVLAPVVSSANLKFEWATPRDRSLADQVRTEVLRALEALSHEP
jgi:hypothetical protein